MRIYEDKSKTVRRKEQMKYPVSVYKREEKSIAQRELGIFMEESKRLPLH